MELADQRAKFEQFLNLERVREELLQKYIDDMSESLLKGDLLKHHTSSVELTIARVRTLAVLRRITLTRRGLVLQFLHEAKLIDKDKPIVDLSGADLQGANLRKADLRGVDLSRDSGRYHADLREANLEEADLSNANLARANLEEADLRGVNLSNAKLTGANLKDAKVTPEQLKQAKSLKGAIMPDGKMYRNSSGANLNGVDLIGVDLIGVDLSGVDLRYADLSKADLSEADLSEVNLNNANLSGANLENANLKDVSGVTEEQLKQPKSLKGATMPDGSKHD
jgi:uncharacterized protein YjbI with pentapeptide repeats